MSDKNRRCCPCCGRAYTAPPALSRMDNRTEICPACGIREALEIALVHIHSEAQEGEHHGRTGN